jgi:hypothetical protein
MSDGDVSDGDIPDGDTTDGDVVDGDENCDSCDFLAGDWCISNPQGAACGQLPVGGVQVSKAEGAGCVFVALITFTNGAPPTSLSFQGCDLDALSILQGVCKLTIDSDQSSVSVECPDICSFDLSQDDCQLGCTCDTEDACCDGCKPINEGGQCDDNNACTQTDSCSFGVCMGGNPVECAALDQCHIVGECDTATGECSNPPAEDATACDDGDPCTVLDSCSLGVCAGEEMDCAAQDDCHEMGACDPYLGMCVNPPKLNGASCDGLGDGTTGSGVCLDGECNPLDECLLRKYNQPLGYACNFNQDCQSELCTSDMMSFFKASFPNVCTQACDKNTNDCPSGFFCYQFGYTKTIGGPESICLPEAGPLPYDGTQGLFEPCYVDDNCESGLCNNDGWLKYCTVDCYGEMGPEEELCGSCGRCEEEYVPLKGDSKRPAYYCYAQERQYPGALCTSNIDCITGFCYENTCTFQCGDRKGPSNCPAGFSCENIGFPYGEACIPNDQVGSKEEDEICTSYYQCTDGLYCDKPPANGVFGMLISEDLNRPVAGDGFRSDDATFYTNFSYKAEVTGTYYLTIRQIFFKMYITNPSAYILNISTGDAATETTAEVEPNHNPAAIDLTTLPASILGVVGIYDEDWFAFELEEGQVVTIATLPVSDHGYCRVEKEFGEACTFNTECASGICLMGTCTEECEFLLRNDSDTCPDTFTCTVLDTIAKNEEKSSYYKEISTACISDDMLGKEYGEDCTFDWECEGGACFMYQCNQYCEFIPVKGADDTCPTGFDCVDPGMVGQTKLGTQICLPEDGYGFAFGESCMYDYQCESGTCYKGACNLNCDSAPVKAPIIECPEGYVCIYDGSDNTCVDPETLNRQFGDACQSNDQCESGYCFDGACNLPCSPLVKEVSFCPDDYSCIYIDGVPLRGAQTACMANDSLDQDFGAACENNYECASGFCYFGRCNVVCDIAKADCPENYACMVSYYQPTTICVPEQE